MKKGKAKRKTTRKRTGKKLSPRILAAKQLSHAQLLAPLTTKNEAQDLPYLGHARAVIIVCACANTSPLNLSRTLEELGVDGNSFQTCVFNGVQHAGYVIDIDDIPNSPDTKLIDAVVAIQNAPKAP